MAAPCRPRAANWAATNRPHALRKLVDGLIAATHAMETRTKELEGELQRSSHEVSELKAKLDDVRKESLTDPLTGIANRKAFDLRARRAPSTGARRNRRCRSRC